MNYWTELSIDYANQRSYLDDLFLVYPTIPEGIRDIDQKRWKEIEIAFTNQDNFELIDHLLKLKKFPLKNSYVSFLRKDPTSLFRNPQTVNRLAGAIYEMGLSRLYEKCTEPKETNTQMGPMFSRWVHSKALGIKPVPVAEFLASTENAILSGNDAVLLNFAFTHFGYNKEKGLDFIARFNGKYVLGEAKFITDIGGNQNAQFNGTINTIVREGIKVEKILMLDGSLCSSSYGKIYEEYSESYKDFNIMSVLVLREFLYQL